MKVCPCKATVHNAFVCEGCLNSLDALLAGMTWLDQQLAITHSRQRGAATEGGPRSTETPIPWHDGASKRRRALLQVLTRHVRALGGYVSEWATPGSLAGDLLTRWDALIVADQGATAYSLLRELKPAVQAARSVVFWKPAARVYLGPCEGRECSCECHGGYACSDPDRCAQPGTEGRNEPCPGEVYAEEDESAGACRECGRKFSVSVKRRAMEAELDDRLYTAVELADLSAFMGLGMDRERVRKQINQWHRRKQLVPAPGGEVRFRYGDVKAMLYALQTRLRG